MEQKKISELTNEELLEIGKKHKSNKIINAFLIGFCIGIIIYSATNNGLGFLTLIPLFIIYKLVNTPNNNAELEEELKARNLK